MPHPGVAWREIIDDSDQLQRDVAQAIGCTEKHVSQIINGHAVPSVELTIRFAIHMRASVYLMWQLVADYRLAQALLARQR